MSKERIISLKEERMGIHEQLQTVLDRMEKNPNADDSQTYETLEKKYDELTSIIGRYENQLKRDREMGETMNGKNPKGEKKDARRELFMSAISGNSDSYAQYMNSYTLGDDDQAGYLTSPMEFRDELIKEVNDEVVMRQVCRILPPIKNSQSIGYPYMKTRAADASWVGEIDESVEEKTMDFGRREFKINRLTKLLVLSKQLLNHSSMAETVLMNEMRYAVGITQEKAYMTGDGTNKPLGIFTASASGISTARDITEGSSATALTAESLIAAKYNLKEGYQRNAKWMMHRLIAKEIRKLKDSNGQYLWQPSLQVGQPDMILGTPVHMSEFAPYAMAADAYVAMIGDFQHYWVADAESLYVQILNEKYATKGQRGYLIETGGDGAPVLEEAFTRVKLAAAAGG